MPKVLCRVPWDFDLIEADDGTLELEVVCGSVGLYERRVTLSVEQVSRWREEGEPYVRALARAVASDPTRDDRSRG